MLVITVIGNMRSLLFELLLSWLRESNENISVIYIHIVKFTVTQVYFNWEINGTFDFTYENLSPLCRYHILNNTKIL